MRYLLQIYSSEAREQFDSLPEEQQKAIVEEYFAISETPGVIGGDQLQPSETATTVRVEDGRTLTTDGPFAEAKEVLGGYWMIQVKSKEEAVEWASRCPASDNEVIEVRQVQEFSDFPADVREVAGKLPELQAQSGQRKES
jgi:hypothetical protein